MPLLISYDLKWDENRKQEYRDTNDKITKELEALGAKRLLYTVWLLQTNASVQSALSRLKPLLRPEDQILVAPTNNELKVENGTGGAFYIRPRINPPSVGRL